MVAGFFYLIGRYFHGSAMITISLRRGLSRKAPSNARGDDPFLGGFFFNFFLPTAGGVPQKPRQDWVFRLIFQAENPLFYFAGTC